MFEVSDSGKEHGDAKFVGLGDGIRIADAAARLHDGGHAVLGCQRDGIVERQEAVRRQYEAVGETGSLRLLEGDFGRADALATGYGEIDEAETIAEVEAALAAAKEVIDAIPTDAELTAEEEAAAAEAAANQAAADAVKEKIAAIGEVEYTDDSKAKIDEARAAYDALTDAQKALVDNADVLIAAETAYAEAKAAAETPDEPTEPDDATENLCFNCGKDHGNNKLAKIICWVVYFVKTMIIKIIPGVKDIIK